jgi:hypothetical protein
MTETDCDGSVIKNQRGKSNVSRAHYARAHAGWVDNFHPSHCAFEGGLDV